MDINMNLTISQEQKLVLTQQMKLSIDVLQYSATELNQFVEEKMQENPLLEKIKTDNEEMVSFLKKIREENRGQGSKVNYDDEYVSPLAFVSEEKDIYDILMEQLRDMSVTVKEREIIEYLIENLDCRGYLKINEDNLMREYEICEDEMQMCIEKLQSMEPVGIGARGLKECLLIQLERAGKDGIIFEMVKDNLELIGKNKFKDIAKIYDIKVAEAQAYGDEIRNLEPKPTRGYCTGEKIVYVTPDVYVKKREGRFVVELNNWTTPRLHVNDIYVNIAENSGAREEEKQYIKEKITDAVSLIKSIEQRKSTLLRVVESIVDRQQEYFQQGVVYLKPMVLKDISEEIGVHESTVSRAIKNKYLQSDNGIILIKELFTAKLESNSFGGETSAKSIKNIIKQIIDDEDKKKPLSDNKISAILEEEGVKISRRTVAKYREEMGIVSTSKRKRF